MSSCVQRAASVSTSRCSGVCGTLPLVSQGHPKAQKQTQCRAAYDQSLPAQASSSSRGRNDPVEAAAVPLELRTVGGAAESLEEYAEMKTELFQRAQRAGGFLALYLLLQQGLVAAACSALGTVAGYIYLRSLVKDVEKYSADSDVPLVRARNVSTQPVRALAISVAAYSQALRPRLLVPITLAAAVGAYNRFAQQPLSNILEFDMLLGFLCYKAGLLLKLYDDMKPKFDPEQLARPVRPLLPELPDAGVEEEREKALRERKRH